MRPPVGELPEIVMGVMLTYWIQFVEGRSGRNADTVDVETRKGNFTFELYSKVTSSGGYTDSERLIKRYSLAPSSTYAYSVMDVVTYSTGSSGSVYTRMEEFDGRMAEVAVGDTNTAPVFTLTVQFRDKLYPAYKLATTVNGVGPPVVVPDKVRTPSELMATPATVPLSVQLEIIRPLYVWAWIV
jgi:hypothetical protein